MLLVPAGLPALPLRGWMPCSGSVCRWWPTRRCVATRTVGTCGDELSLVVCETATDDGSRPSGAVECGAPSALLARPDGHFAALVGALGPGAAAAVRLKASAGPRAPRAAVAVPSGERAEAAHVEVEVDAGGWCGPSCVGGGGGAQ